MRGPGHPHRRRRDTAVRRRLRAVARAVAPYDSHNARRVGAAIISLFAVSLFVGTLAVPLPGALMVIVAYVVPAVLLACSALLIKAGPVTDPLLFGFCQLGVAMILVLNLVTKDASAGAQVAFCAPVMFAASQLRPAGALFTLAASIACEIAVVVHLKEVNAAINDAVYVSSTLMAIGILLILAVRRQYRLLEQLERRATVDPLTGLVTRRVLDDAVRAALLERRPGRGTAMVLIDIDHFKSVNDTYGHPVGDDALVHIATTLRSLVRADCVVSRLGGDELAVLLPRCTLGSATAGAQAFVDAVRRHPLTVADRGPLSMTVSVGVGFAARNEIGLRELYAAADASLYDAKRAGRDRVGTPVSSADSPPQIPTPREQPGPPARTP